MDPGEVPPEPEGGLTQVDEMRIALANSTLRVYKPHRRQRGYGGHIVNTYHDVSVLVLRLAEVGS